MIKVTELKEARPTVRYQNGNITLPMLQEVLENCAEKMMIPVAFKMDEVVAGTKRKDGVEECLVMYHPEHEKDYVKFCIRVKKQGIYAFVSVHEYGQSKFLRRDKVINGASMGAVAGGLLSANVASAVAGLAVGSLLKKKVSPNQFKVEEEKNYYACISAVFDEVIS